MAEVALCGHATLASAHVLWEEDLVPVEARITFQTLSGPLYASLDAGWIQLAFPLLPESHSLSEKRLSVLSTIIDCPILHAGQNHLGDILAVVDSEAAVRGVTPDFTLLAQVESRGLLVTAEATDSRYDFISRCFFPRLGIPEDPVTGSAHCYLADYWGKRLQKETLLAYQASPRGGVLKLIRLDNEHLLLMGQAITTLTGEIHHVTPEKLVPLSSRPSPP